MLYCISKAAGAPLPHLLLTLLTDPDTHSWLRGLTAHIKKTFIEPAVTWAASVLAAPTLQ
jgi:hypothetical protein